MRENAIRALLMRCLLVALLVCVVALPTRAFDNQQSWLDGSLDADDAMAMLENDTDQPLALVELEAHQEEEQQHQLQELQQEQEAEQEERERAAQEEEEAQHLAMVEMNAARAKQAAPAPKPKRSSIPEVAAVEDDPFALAALMETATRARASVAAQWRSGAPRRRTRVRHSVRAERERLATKARQEEQYAANLRKLEVRHKKWSRPATSKMPAFIHRVQEKMLTKLGAKQDAIGFMSNEEAQVESLLQVRSKPMLTLSHKHDVHAKLTSDMLRGTGLNNAANRRATEAGLAASPDNRPQAPAFVPLDAPVGQNQPAEMSFIAKTEVQRPMYAGPETRNLPAIGVAGPTVLHSRPAPAAAAAAAPVSENDFVAGLPPAFLELDPATQMQILALADAGVDVHAEPKAEVESKPTSMVETVSKTSVEAESEAESDADSDSDSESDSESDAEVDETDLAAAASTLNALAMLQKSSNVPFAKLVRLLAHKQ